MGAGSRSSSSGRAPIAAVLGCAVLAVAAGARGATPAYPAYPTAKSLPIVADWLRAQTDVPLGSVIGVGDDSVFSLEPTADPAPAPTIRATIRQEVTNAAFATKLGGRSAVMVADIDCQGRRVIQRALDLYAGNNKQGAVRRLGGVADWQAVPVDTFMGRVLAAVCDPDYQPLFPGGQVPAAAPGGSAAPAPQPTAAFEAPPRFASRRRPAAPLTGPSIPLIAPVARAAAPPAAPPAAAAPTPASPSAPARTGAPPAPRLTPAYVAPASPDGPITTEPSARPLLIAPQAPPPPRAAPSAPPPRLQAAAPIVRPPPPLPTPQALAAAPAPAPRPAAPPPRPPTPTAVALGLRPLTLGRADLGVFASLDEASETWRRDRQAFPEAFEGRRQRVELSTAGQQTRFRLYADGFAGPAEVAAFCRELRAGGQACAPVQ